MQYLAINNKVHAFLSSYVHAAITIVQILITEL